MGSRVPGGGFFSTSFTQPLGTQTAEGELRGYYIDMRVKADSPEWPPATLSPVDRQLHVDVIQWGLGCFEHFVATGDERWLAGARACGEHLVREQVAEGEPAGGWLHPLPYPHTYRLEPPWMSAMAQGQGVSLLLRLHGETGEEPLAEAARRALAPLDKPLGRGGVRSPLGDGWFLEEYPTDPASYVLNGGIFALWGYHDAAIGLDDPAAEREFQAGVDSLAGKLQRWDTGSWSRYDLYPHLIRAVASPAYHELHIAQLHALQALAPRDEIRATATRWEAYGSSRAKRRAALARKVVFRLAVPRNRLLAHRMPWERR